MNKFKPVGISIPKFQQGTGNNGVQLLEYKGPQYHQIQEQMKREDPWSYNRLREASAQTSTSEVSKPWVDSEGKVRRSSNVEAGYVSGTDPIGQLYVEGSILNKPLQWAGRGITNIFKGILKPKLGNPNNYLDYHLSRLGNKNPEILTPDEFALKYWKQAGKPEPGQTTDDFIKEVAEYVRSQSPVSQKVGENIPVVIEREGSQSISKLFRNKNLTPRQQRNLVISHEVDHSLNIPQLKDAFPKGFDFSKLPEDIQKYFLEGMGTEMRARGSQIKDFFGLVSRNQGITGKQLKYAADNYVNKTGIDNQMTEFFNSITDYNEAAKWISKYASMFLAPATLGTYFYGQDKNN